MNAMIPFSFEGAEVRVIGREGDAWFVLADVCRVLEIGNSRQAASRLDDDEKDTVSTNDGITGCIDARAQQVTLVNESGLWALVFTSRKPSARRLRKFVTGTVLPQIRKTGMYIPDGVDAGDDLPVSADNKVFGVRLAKANAAARLISAVNAIYGPEAARALWERDEHLPKLSHLSVGSLAGTPSDDPIGCFRHLMRGAVAGRGLGSLVAMAAHDGAVAKGLVSYGLKFDPKEAPGFLAIANRHPYLDELFAGTQWAGDWRIALGQLPGARPSRGAIGFSDGAVRAVLISRGEVSAMLNPVRN